MTPEQLATLKTYIQGQQDIATMFSDGNLPGVADALNVVADPTFYVWRTEVSQDEIMQNGFDWVRVDNLSVGKARIWEWLFDNSTATINPSKSNVRAGISECWKGTAADVSVRHSILQHCQRPASRFERVFATGTGTSTNDQGVGPGSLVVVGPLGWTELVNL